MIKMRTWEDSIFEGGGWEYIFGCRGYVDGCNLVAVKTAAVWFARRTRR